MARPAPLGSPTTLRHSDSQMPVRQRLGYSGCSGAGLRRRHCPLAASRAKRPLGAAPLAVGASRGGTHSPASGDVYRPRSQLAAARRNRGTGWRNSLISGRTTSTAHWAPLAGPSRSTPARLAAPAWLLEANRCLKSPPSACTTDPPTGPSPDPNTSQAPRGRSSTATGVKIRTSTTPTHHEALQQQRPRVCGWLAPRTRSRSARVRSNSGIASPPAQPPASPIRSCRRLRGGHKRIKSPNR